MLRALLRPLMWRNTKAEVAEEYSLPPRSLLVSHLDFQSGEREVYQQVRARTLCLLCLLWSAPAVAGVRLAMS